MAVATEVADQLKLGARLEKHVQRRVLRLLAEQPANKVFRHLEPPACRVEVLGPAHARRLRRGRARERARANGRATASSYPSRPNFLRDVAVHSTCMNAYSLQRAHSAYVSGAVGGNGPLVAVPPRFDGVTPEYDTVWWTATPHAVRIAPCERTSGRRRMPTATG